MSKENADSQAELGKSQRFYYKKFREKQKIVDIDDNQFSEAIGLNNEMVKKDISRWDVQINGMATSK